MITSKRRHLAGVTIAAGHIADTGHVEIRAFVLSMTRLADEFREVLAVRKVSIVSRKSWPTKTVAVCARCGHVGRMDAISEPIKG